MEALTWVGVGLVLSGYIYQRRAAIAATLPPTVDLSTQDEVDPTRWRHNGKQPNGWEDGNRDPNIDSFAEERRLANALSF